MPEFSGEISPEGARPRSPERSAGSELPCERGFGQRGAERSGNAAQRLHQGSQRRLLASARLRVRAAARRDDGQVPAPRLPELSPTDVVNLTDELLSNADRLLNAAVAVIKLENVALARSLAILALEESGKAIALHQRRVQIAYEDEGTPFVNEALQELWRSHPRKLELVHQFLVDENYWFDTTPPIAEKNLAYLGEIKAWAKDHNVVKQNGFYVDVQDGQIVAPKDSTDREALMDVVDHVHQIGWQLRLGEHIEAKGQADSEREIAPATPEELDEARSIFGSLEPDELESMLQLLREGTPGTKLNNRAYRHLLPPAGTDPLLNLGKPGYEAETRELRRLYYEGQSED